MIEKFIEYLKYEKSYSDYTIINYEEDLKQFYEFVNEKKIDYYLIRDYLRYMHDNNYSKTSISRKISTLRSYFKYLVKENYIKEDPTLLISNPKTDKKLPNFLSYENLNILLNTPDTKNILGLRDTLILEMLYSTGLRVSELVSIKIKNISNDSIKIIGKGNKERIVLYGTNCKKLLDEYLKRRKELLKKSNDYLFLNSIGGTLTDRSIRNIINGLVKKSGLKIKVTPHTLRHTFATHMLNEGADIKSVGDLLGHENISTTTIYTHVSNERLRKVYLDSHPRAKK